MIPQLRISKRPEIPPCPNAGNGVHKWLFRSAILLHRCNITPGEIATRLINASRDCGRRVSDSEISQAIQNSARLLTQIRYGSQQHVQSEKGWPETDLISLKNILSQGIGINDLQQASPVHSSLDDLPVKELVSMLFDQESLICCGKSPQRCQTMSVSHWLDGLEQQSYIVPSTMKNTKGVTKEGKPSPRCLSNVKSRKYLVIEFDFTPESHSELFAFHPNINATSVDLCAAILLHLAKDAPLGMVVHSGGKSLHGWFPLADLDEARCRQFMALAVSLGADPATWSPIQLVRMPNGWRDNRVKQEVKFFNPEVLS